MNTAGSKNEISVIVNNLTLVTQAADSFVDHPPSALTGEDILHA